MKRALLMAVSLAALTLPAQARECFDSKQAFRAAYPTAHMGWHEIDHRRCYHVSGRAHRERAYAMVALPRQRPSVEAARPAASGRTVVAIPPTIAPSVTTAASAPWIVYERWEAWRFMEQDLMNDLSADRVARYIRTMGHE